MARRWLEKIVDMRPGEPAVAFVSACYFFCLLFGYFLLRPLRETMGLEGGVDRLRWLFLGTLVVMIGVNVAYGFVVARFPRRVFVPLVYRFAIACLLVFLGVQLFLGETLANPQSEQDKALARTVGSIFYVWLSVFNVFAVTVFWGFMADVFTLKQGKRLFGFIGVGGTAGAIAGSAVAWQLADEVGPIGLVAGAIVLLELAARFAKWLGPAAQRAADVADAAGDAATRGSTLVGGTAWSGLVRVVRSPFLLAIAGYLVIFTVTSTLLYFEKMDVVDRTVEDRNQRTSIFALIELGGQTATILLQLFLTGRLMKALGVGGLLTMVPIVSIIGFTALMLEPTLLVVGIFEAVRRASNFALSKPARETLFTVMTRDDKFKAKSVIDTFVYRGGDVVGTLAHKGLAVAAVAAGVLAIPLGVVGTGLAVWLGWRVTRQGTPTATADDSAG